MTFLGLSTRVVRTALTALVVLDLLAVAAFAVHRTTVTTRTTRPVASSQPSSGSSTQSALPPVTVGSQPLTATGVTVPAVSSSSSGPSGGDTSIPPTTSVTPPAIGVPPVQVAAIGKCPIKLATPAELGGVQSLVAFAPAFGPFSAEAFAAAAAYQPELELLGPILAEYPKFAPVIGPALAPLLALFATGSNSLFGVISPFYTPHRTAVLSAETKLGAALAPLSAKLAGTPLAGCVVDVEAALVGDTKHATSKAALRRELTRLQAKLVKLIKLEDQRADRK
jgi:hypothetical protein